MALIIKDRVMESSTTTGTGAMTLAGAYTGFRSFSSVCSTNDTCYYMIEAVDSNGVPTGDWETGLGTYSAANTLTRTTVLASSNSGSAVSFAAGTKRVAISVIASNIAIGAYPTATASDTAVNGSASTFMRSDAAPAVQKASSSQFGIVEVDGKTITASGGVISAGWKLISSVTPSGTSAVVTGLDAYTELLILAKLITSATGGFRFIQASTDGGSTFYVTSGDYATINSTGSVTNQGDMGGHSSSLTTSSVMCQLSGNIAGDIKMFRAVDKGTGYCANAGMVTNAINAIQLGSTVAMTGGTLVVYGR